ncbi:MAG: stage III sporulation protein AF [Syntrophomonadaceae bacterium]|jgi:stage III sporulation protein AF|nr:stage III sporulation protein AF [Syntrophomonadaceae bacterium]
MDVLVEIVKNLLVIIILASFLELLLPGGGMKPYVRLAIGMFVLIAVLTPVIRCFYPGEALHISSWEWSNYGAEQQEVLQKGSELHSELIAQSNESVRSKLEGQISAIAMLVPGVAEVDSKIVLNEDGSIQKVTINVSGQDNNGADPSSVGTFWDQEEARLGPDVEARMARIVMNMFGLSEQQIEIQVQGGS